MNKYGATKTYCSFTTKNGTPCVVRDAQKKDAGDILSLKMEMLESGLYDALLPEEYTSDEAQEAEWIALNQQGDDKFIAVCEHDGNVDGVLYFQCSNEVRCRHWGELGMSVRDAMRGQGLGTKLLEALFEWAQQSPQVEKICLKVFDVNEGAHKLYKKLGFIEEGRLKKCLRLKDGTYADAILMAKFIDKNKK